MAEAEQELRILEAIERNPDVTQASLAGQLDVAVGKVNWYLKRLVTKGYVKVTHLQRRKLHYFLTPAGLALKFELTRSYMEVSLRVYRELRAAAHVALAEVRAAGCASVAIEGQDEAVEILRLTCLEQGMHVGRPGAAGLPLLRSEGRGFAVIWPGAGRPGDDQAPRREATEEWQAAEKEDGAEISGDRSAAGPLEGTRHESE